MKTLDRKLSWGLCAAMVMLVGSARSATQDVSIISFSFQPASVSINTGDSVRWTENENAFHTTTSDDSLWDSGTMQLNQQFSFQFDTAGDYPYHCTTHPFMTANVTVTASSNQPPIVSITSPTNGASFTAPAIVPINANASDPDGSVTNVAFFDGTTFLGQTNQTPYSLTATFGAGVHPLTAVATDNLGLSATSSIVSVTVSAGNSPPSVTITNPADGAVFGNTDTVAIRGVGTDSDGSVTNVQLFNGNVLLRTFTTASFSFNATAIAGNLALGTNTLIAIATDNLGAKGTSGPVHVVISRYLPPVPTGSIAITLLAVATNLSAPDYGISPPGDKTRLFVLEQGGLIRVLENGVLNPTPALDISNRVSPPLIQTNPNDERGLLGIAFHPGYTNAASPGYRTLYTYNSEQIPPNTSPTYPFQRRRRTTTRTCSTSGRFRAPMPVSLIQRRAAR